MRRHPYRMKILAYLASQSLSVAEFNVIHFAHYASCPPRMMIRMAHAESIGVPDFCPASSRADCRDAISCLMGKGLLQIIDDAALRRIDAKLTAEPAFGPIDGLPDLGDLDFTSEGGALWQRINRELFNGNDSDFWTGLGEADTEDTMTLYACSESTLRQQIDHDSRFSGREILAVSEIVPIGPWRDRWWNAIMEQGFQAILTYGASLDEA
jgi:hypothetical protein